MSCGRRSTPSSAFPTCCTPGRSPTPEKVHQYTGYIKQAAEHLLELINGILDVSKIQAGKLSVEREPVELGPILASCLLIVEAKAREKNISVELPGRRRTCRCCWPTRCA